LTCGDDLRSLNPADATPRQVCVALKFEVVGVPDGCSQCAGPLVGQSGSSSGKTVIQ